MHSPHSANGWSGGTRVAAVGFILRRVTIRPPRERRVWTALVVIGTFGFLIALSIATNIELATGRGMAVWKWASLGMAIVAGYSMVRMYRWPVEIRRPLLFALLDAFAWYVLLGCAYRLLLMTTVFVMWYRSGSTVPLIVFVEAVPGVFNHSVVIAVAAFTSMIIQRYVYRQLRVVMGRCVRCEYRLFGLTTPRCPECGTPFDPSKISHIDAGAL